MKSQYHILHRVTAVLLSIVFIISMIPAITLNASAASNIVREVDPSTMNDWKNYFGSLVGNTTNAGGVWTDKSVFTDAGEFANAGVVMDDADSNFLVALSAIASSKQIVGYSNIPTDTMLVLDMSGSMSNTAVANMVTATNDAINKLQNTNNHNRVGVVLYSGNSNFGDSNTSTAEVILPLDRWNSATNRWGNDIGFVSANNGTISVNSGVSNEDNTISYSNNTVPSKDSTGGTYIQNGLWKAWKEFEAADDKVISDGFQAGTKRLPIMVLMSDGAPTAATNNYNNVGTSNIGDGDGSCATEAVGFITQLTAGYVKAKMEEAYGRDALFYTLGLGINDNDVVNPEVALSVLDTSKSTSNIRGYWDTFLGLSSNNIYNYMSLKVPDTRNSTQTVQIAYDNMFAAELVDGKYESKYEDYVDKYTKADDAEDLISGFADIVNAIILQSKYYPTLVESGDHNFDGYITINDEIGEFMEVKDIKGLLIGDTLFSGATLASKLTEADMGTVDNPKEFGDLFARSVQTRLGISKDVAQDLIDDAYNYGQLSYTSATEYSNMICWYADEDNNYKGFWHEELGYGADNAPDGATYIIHSYGFLGETSGSIKDSDMMYCSVQIRTEIVTGKQTVWWRIPASLVPMSIYEITLEGDSVDTATNIKMTCTDADPIRLVYEVGLQDDINELTVSEVMKNAGAKHQAQDGSYYFWTNRWGNKEDGGFDYSDPHTHLATTSEFCPSLENERYYYHENTTVYKKTLLGGYEAVPTSENIDENATYYHRRSIFVNTGNGNEAVIEYVYEAITPESLAKAMKVDAAGEAVASWYIPKGNIYQLLGDYINIKTENVTKSLEYSNYPIVHFHDIDGYSEYRADYFLGNNGRLTLTPATGLKITKQIDVVSPDTNTDFRFEIELGNATLAESYPYRLFNAAGEKIGEGSLDVEDGKISFTMSNTHTIYITDLPDGATYTVSEKSHVDYILHSVNGDTSAVTASGVITQNTIGEALFVNTLKETGILVIAKKVVHPFEDTYTIPADKKFTVEVTLEGEGVAGEEFATSAGYYVEVGTDGKFTLTLGAGESIAIHDLPEGTKYTVEETSIPDGFSIDTSSTGLVGVIPADSNIEANIVNRYIPEKVTPVDITLVGTKTLEGRDWLATDEFTFELQRYVGSDYVTVASETVTSADRSYDFTDEMKAQVFDAVGIYQFKIIEVKGTIGGVTYDSVQRYFHVTVEDKNMDGKLEIASVDVTPPVTMTANSVNSGTQYDLVADFTNSYAPSGSAQALINIKKNITNDTGITVDLSGFKFGLYNEAGELVAESVETNALGETAIGMTYTPAFAGQTMTYYLREIVPADEDKLEGMTYSTQEYIVEITVTDMLDGTVAATVALVGATDGSTNGNTANTTFTNIYDLEDAKADLDATKTLNGRDLADNEFTFVLYQTGSDFAVTGDALQTKKNVSDKVDFDELTFNSIGTYYYVVKEVEGTLGGVTYDETEYRVTIVVTKGEGATLRATVTMTDDLGTEKTAINFENEYKPEPITHVIDGTKTLNGRALADGEFRFALYNANASFETVGEAIDIKTNTNGTFVFDELTYDVKGTHYYVVKEVKGTLGGIIYDETEYHITVTVTDNGDGTLSVSETIANGNSIAFTNTYDPTDAQVDLSGTKKLTGRDLVAGEFKFELYNANDQYVTSGAAIQTKGNAANGTVTFDSLTYVEAGTHYYVIKEDSSDALGGVQYDGAQFNVKVVVTDDGEGTLAAVTTIVKAGGEASDVIFENKYVPTPIDETLEAVKKLEGRNLNAGEFTFELYEANENFAQLGGALQTKKNAADGSVKFDALTFTEKGTYRYLVKEIAGTLGGVKYDTTVYCVTFEVTDDGKGTLTAEKTVTVLDSGASADAIVFNNEYTANSTSEALEALKILTGRDLKANEFEFELYSAESNYARGQLLQTKKNASDGSVIFDSITYTDTGDNYYIIVEKTGSLGGVDYDERVYGAKVTVADDGKGNLNSTVSYLLIENGSASDTDYVEFENAYSADPAELVVEGSKELTGRPLSAGEFKFDIFKADSSFIAQGSAVKTASNNGDGTFAFEAIEFDAAGTYYFVVKEDASAELGGVTYDSKTYNVTVTVADDGNGNLVATYISELNATEADIKFTNSYAPEGTNFALNGLKTLSGRDLNAGEFFFELYAADSSYAKTGDALQKVSNDGEGKFEFEAVALDAVGTFYYAVVEKGGQLGGVTYDETVYGVEVVVEDNLTGNLVATVTVTNRTSGNTSTILFANTYTPAGTEVVLSGTKTLTGRDMKDGEFTFELYSADENYNASGDAIRSVTNNEDGSFAFEAVKYDTAGTYYYAVVEKAGSTGGVSYDETVYGVNVVVTDDLAGALVATTTIVNKTTGADAAILFANSYTPDGTTATVSGVKRLDGRELKEGEFTFELYSATSAYEQTGEALQSVTNASDGSFSFEAITLNETGTFYYVVVEKAGEAGGVDYDETVYGVKITVDDNLEGNLVAKASVVNKATGEETTILFVNTYKPASTSVTIDGTKTLSGRDLNAGEFKFELYETKSNFVVSGSALRTATNTANGSFAFGAIEYDTAGTYYYVVREDASAALGGVTYDSTEYAVIVKVTDDGNGKLKAETELYKSNGTVSADEIVFENVYDPDSVSVTYTGVKILDGRDMKEGEFTFELYAANEQYVAQGVAIKSATNAVSGAFGFEALTFNETGTFYYVVTEKAGNAGGVSYDKTVYGIKIVVNDNNTGNLVLVSTIVDVATNDESTLLFTNTYTPAETEVVISGTKQLDGREMNAGEFTFELYSANDAYVINGDAIDSVTNAANGNFAFEAINYDKADTYYYVVVEKAGDAGGVDYDETVYGVKVSVTDDLEGALVPTVAIVNMTSNEESPILFVNTYTPASTSVNLNGVKTLTGRDMKEGEFTFQVYAANSSYTAEGNAIGTASNKADGSFAFEALTFDKVGTYYYVVSEKSGEAGGVTYDTTVYGVKVVVTDNKKGELVAETTVTNTASGAEETLLFANSYKPASVDASFEGVKTLDGRDLNANEFKFDLFAANSNYVASGNAVASATNDVNGKFTFDAQTFDTVGTYYYVITEDDSAALGGVGYDGSKYGVKVSVTDDGNGQLEASVQYYKSATEVDEVKFANTYTPDSTAVDLNGVKTLSGRDLNAGEFTFELYEADSTYAVSGNALQSVVNAENGAFSFATLTFDKTGTYYYAVLESEGALGGVSYDKSVYGVKVVVTDNLAGDLVANTTIVDKSTGENAAILFANSYTPAETEVVVSGTKTLSGRDLNAGEFVFELYNANSDYERVGEAIRKASNSADGSFSFDAVKFDKADTYYYVVVEKSGSLGGISYDDTVYGIKVVVEDNLEGALVAKTTVTVKGSDSEAAIIFANSYTPAETTVTVSGVKTLSGREMNEGEFTFELYNASSEYVAGSEAIRSAVNASDGSFSFEALTFDKVGTYYYVVVESAGEAGGVTYDKTVYGVKVVVTDDLNGNLVAVTTIVEKESGEEGTILFANSYVPANTSAVISGVKTLSGRDMNEGEFRFDLYEADENFAEVGDVYKSAANTANGTFAFEAIEYDKVGTYRYIVKENSESSLGGVTYDETTYRVTVVVTDNLAGALEAEVTVTKADGSAAEEGIQFVNTYKPAETTVDLSGVKTLVGRDMAEGEFKFELYGTDAEFNAQGNALQSVENGAEGIFSFETLTFDSVGTYYYTVVEHAGEAGGVTYDSTVYCVKVVVTDDLNGNLVAKTSIVSGEAETETILFVNAYTPASVEVIINGVKTLDGRELKAGEFTFEIFEATETFEIVGDAMASSLNAADGSFAFEALEFTETGVYYFAVTENASDALKGVTYDDAVYYITVTVTDNLEGNLLADVNVSRADGADAETLVFANTFVPDDITVEIAVDKTVENKSEYKLGESGFKFTLVDMDGNVIGTVVTDENGNAVFELVYGADAVGETFIYKLSEVDTGVENVKYSTEVYDIEVVIGQDENGQLTATVKVNGEETDDAKAEFVNVYEVPEKGEDDKNTSAPQTGDAPLWLCWTLMFLSGSGIIMIVIYDRKKKTA